MNHPNPVTVMNINISGGGMINICKGGMALTSETLPAARPWEVSRWKYTFGPGQTSQTHSVLCIICSHVLQCKIMEYGVENTPLDLIRHTQRNTLQSKKYTAKIHLWTWQWPHSVRCIMFTSASLPPTNCSRYILQSFEYQNTGPIWLTGPFYIHSFSAVAFRYDSSICGYKIQHHIGECNRIQLANIRLRE